MRLKSFHQPILSSIAVVVAFCRRHYKNNVNMKSFLLSVWFLIVSASASASIRKNVATMNAQDYTSMMPSILEKLAILEDRVQRLEVELSHEREERRRLQDAAATTTTETTPSIPDVNCELTKVIVDDKRYCKLDAPLKVTNDFILEGDADLKDDLRVRSTAKFNGNVLIDGPSTVDSSDSSDSDEEQETTKFEIEGHVRVIIDSEEKFKVKTESYFEDDVEIKKDYSSGSHKKDKQPSLTLAGNLDVEYGDVTIEEGDLVLEHGNLDVEKGKGYFHETVVADDGIEASGDVDIVGGVLKFGSSGTEISADGITVNPAGIVEVGDSSLTTSTLTVGGTLVNVP